jgi:hypothetical protein
VMAPKNDAAPKGEARGQRQESAARG